MAAVTLMVLVGVSVAKVTAGPTIPIHADDPSYTAGDTIKVSLAAYNPGEMISVDVFIGLVTPGWEIYTLGPSGWTASLSPWLSGISLPMRFGMMPTEICRIEVPSSMPPISEGNAYNLAAVLTYAGTLDWACSPSMAPFTVENLQPARPIRMLPIPAGSFLMGSPDNETWRNDDEGPQRTVNISAFLMSETEITQRQWESLMGWNDSYFSFRGDNHPVEMVTWFDCVIFCNQLSQRDGLTMCYTITNIEYDRWNSNHIVSADVTCDFEADGYRLPTEAEWEYACRAGTTTRYYWGDSSHESIMKQYCWYERNADDGFWTDPHADIEGTQPVGQKIPNAFGLYDMAGNVSEWCWDWYQADYYRTRPDPDTDPTGPGDQGWGRVGLSGAWDDPAAASRSACRFSYGVCYYFDELGLRVVRSAD